MKTDSQKTNRVTILGSGTSTGVPMLGCDCDICTSSNPKNTRMRCSILLQTSTNKKILVDTTPDLRFQLLQNKVKELDFVFITHDHADHLHGIDDLRPLSFKHKDHYIDLYTFPECHENLIRRFDYIFTKPTKPLLGGGIPRLKLNQVKTGHRQSIQGEAFYFFKLPHGHSYSMGIQHEKMAYLIDCHEIPSEVLEHLQKQSLELLIIDCVTDKPHKSHLHVEKAFQYAKQIGARQTGLIHMNHRLDHDALEERAKAELNEFSFVTYDTMQIHY